MDTVSDALKFMRARSLSDAMRDREQRNKMMLDAARGGLMGVTTDVLGYPVDLMTTALRPFGYNVEKPVGGSDWLADKLTNPTGSVAETAGRVATGMLTPGPEDMLRMAGVLRPKAPVNELTTYHGSPHRITNVDADNPLGKFDLSKIGTGEGAQAYGHGIYLAENADVAKNYAPRDFDYEDQLMKLYKRAEAKQDYDSMEVLESAMLHASPTELRAQYPNAKIVDQIEKLNASRKSGHFYTVDLPDEHIAKMLDWDAPLSEQPEAVKKLLRGSDIAPDESVWDQYTGQQLYEGEMQAGGPYKASGWANAESRKAVSEKLRSLGIPGIKYFDGGSRAAGEGTRNFVIFDPDIAKILKRE